MSNFIICQLCDRVTGLDEASYTNDEPKNVQEYIKERYKIVNEMACNNCLDIIQSEIEEIRNEA